MLKDITIDLNIRKYLVSILIIIPFGFLIYWMVNLSIDIPFSDEWSIADLLSKKELFFADIWKQHNEHHMLFSNLIILAIAYFSHWNIYWEISCNIILSILCFFIIFQQLCRIEKDISYKLPYIFWLVFSFIYFSISQYENWLWGFQVAIFLQLLAMLQGLTFLIYWRDTLSKKYFTMAIFCGIIASYSFASGLVYWVAAPLFIFNFSRRDLPYIIIWVIVFLCVTFLYFYGYIEPSHTSGVEYGLKKPFLALLYATIFIGSPLASSNVILAMAFGTVGIIIFIHSYFSQYKNIRKYGAISFFFIIAVYAIINAIVIGLARAEFGLGQALSSRYITISTLFWIALITIKSSAIPLSYIEKMKWHICMVSILFFALMTYFVDIANARDYFQKRVIVRNYIIGHGINNLDDKILENIYPDPEFIKKLLPFLAANNLSLFRKN